MLKSYKSHSFKEIEQEILPGKYHCQLVYVMTYDMTYDIYNFYCTSALMDKMSCVLKVYMYLNCVELLI